MFGFLKKKLKEAADKISNVVTGESKPEEKPHEKETVKKPELEYAQETTILKKSVEPETEKQIEPVEEPSPEVPSELAEEKPVEESSHDVTETTPEPTETKPEPETPVEVLEETPVVTDVELEQVEEPVPVVKPEPVKEEPEKKSFFQKITSVVTEKKISEAEVTPILEEMKLSLFESDVAVDVAEKICEDLRVSLTGQSVKRGEVEKIIHSSLRKSLKEILNQEQIDLFELANEKKPLKIIFLGFNGTGKTTTIARLGKLFKDENKKVLFAAADTWRAAAQEQLEIHGKNLGIDVIKHKYGADPAAVIFDAIKAAEARDVDIVLADTAGRSQANIGLMDEMKKIVRVNKPDLKILVVDCLTGNDAVDQAQLFNEAVGIDAIIMTKADVYDKGGAVLSAAHTINRPILYIGTGQDYSDLKKFNPAEIVENLLS
jgi:fused signal recognition particle receptor